MTAWVNLIPHPAVFLPAEGQTCRAFSRLSIGVGPLTSVALGSSDKLSYICKATHRRLAPPVFLRSASLLMLDAH